MRKLLLLACLTISFAMKAQVSTSDEEYNYLTKGYPEQIKNGNDMKSGYVLEPFSEHGTEDGFLIKTSRLKETSTNSVKAISIVVIKKNEKFRYLCLPINNKVLFKKFMSDYDGLGMSMGYAMDISAFLDLSNLLSK